MALPTFTLRSATANANAPFTIAQPFKQGDVPAGVELVADIADFQSVVKSTWPDGSAKIAILSGRAALTANVVRTVALSIGASSGGTALSITDLKATSVVATLALTGAKDWTFDTAAHTVGARLSASSVLDVIDASSAMTVNNSAALASYAMAQDVGDMTYVQTASLSGGTVDQLQTVTCTIKWNAKRNITAISKAANARIVTGAAWVFTGSVTNGRGYDQLGSDIAAVGNTVTFAGINGMTQMNGLTGTITAVGPGAAWIEVNIDSTGFSTFTSGGTVTKNQMNTSMATIVAYVRTGGGLSWNGTAMAYSASNSITNSGASWATTAWDAPFMTWVSGPKMSSWIYRKVIGSDRHLVAWLEVRLYSGGEVEIFQWIENGHLKVITPTSKIATYSLTLGGTERFNASVELKHHQRTPLISGTALSYWLGTDPGVTPRHDVAYLQATELVPTYSATRSATGMQLAASYTPLAATNFIYDGDSMQSSGYQRPIGLLPEHDVAYMVCNDQPELTYGAVVRNGFAAGRYGIHYRDENTNRPARFSIHPNLVISDNQGFKDNGGSTTNDRTAFATGTNPPTWDIAHSPSVGYMAYLVTGRWYFMEEAQFAATCNYLGNGSNAPLRDGSLGLMRPAFGAWQTRSCAWDWRTRTQALTITPDDDTGLRAEFIASMQSNIDFFHNTYIVQANNPFGFIEPGEGGYGNGLGTLSPWQQDFVTAAIGMSVSMDLPVSSASRAKLYEFFQWKAKSVVMRLGAQGSFWYVNAAPYVVTISPSAGNPDYATGTGPWHTTESQIYNSTYAVAPSWLSNTEGVLGAEYSSDTWASSMWGNLQPAIAYAVRHGVPGALEGRNRMLAASNYTDLENGFTQRPVWGVAPSSVGTAPPPVEMFSGHCVRAYTTDYFPGKVVAGHRGMGLPASSIPSNGTHGPGYAYEQLALPADANKAIMGRILVYPATGTFIPREDTSFSFAPAQAGTESFTYQLYVDGKPFGAPKTKLLISGTAGQTVPNPPTVALVPGDGQVIATVTPPGFNGGVTITSYRVVLSTGQLFDGPGPSFTFTVANGTPVSATATATNAIGTSTASVPSLTVTPSATLSVPGAPVIGLATALTTAIRIAFSAPTNDGNAPIFQYIATASTGESVTGASSPLVISNLSAGVARTITVRAVNPLGTGPASAASNSVTPLAVVNTPGAPIIGSAVAGDGTITVTFGEPADNGGSAIIGYIATASTGEVVTGPSSPLTFTGMSIGARTVTVAAINSAGSGPESSPSGEVILAGTPSAPKIGTALADDGVIVVEFEPPVSDGGLPVTSYRAVTSGGNVGVGTDSPVIITGVANGFAQTVTVTAINDVGPGLPSDPSNKATPHQSIAMVPIASIVSRVLIYAPTANTITVTKAIREAAIQLCNDVKLWRYEQAISYAGADFIELAGPNQSQVLEVQHARFDGLTIEPRTMRWMDGFMEGWRDGTLIGTPNVYTQVELDRVVLAPVRPGVARFSLVVVPSEDATDLPAFVADKYRELIAHGALGRVLMIPNQPYSDPGKGALALEEFARQVNTLKNRAVYGQQRARVRTKPSYF